MNLLDNKLMYICVQILVQVFSYLRIKFPQPYRRYISYIFYTNIIMYKYQLSNFIKYLIAVDPYHEGYL